MRQIDSMTPKELETLHLKGMLGKPAPETSAAAGISFSDILLAVRESHGNKAANSIYAIAEGKASCEKQLGAIVAELERVKQQLAEARETIKQARTQAVAEIRLQQAKRNKVEQSNSRLLVALKDAEAMLSAGNEQGIGVIRAAIAATEQCGREVK